MVEASDIERCGEGESVDDVAREEMLTMEAWLAWVLARSSPSLLSSYSVTCSGLAASTSRAVMRLMNSFCSSWSHALRTSPSKTPVCACMRCSLRLRISFLRFSLSTVSDVLFFARRCCSILCATDVAFSTRPGGRGTTRASVRPYCDSLTVPWLIFDLYCR
jgi:hypothetical protein